jgi:ribosome maturation factor RimP
VDPDVPPPARMGWREAIVVTVTGLGYELVDVERAQRGLLRITIDRVPGHAYAVPGEFVIVEDCEQVTRQLQYALEVEGLEYSRLEVSSPGLDRPLKTDADYARFAGQEVKLTLKSPFEGRKAWQGVLTPGDDGALSLVFKAGKTEQVLGFKLDEVREARLVPVLDFKGRKAGGGEDRATAAAVDGEFVAGEAPAAGTSPGVDGG